METKSRYIVTAERQAALTARVAELEAALREVETKSAQWSRSSSGGFAALRDIARAALAKEQA